MNLPRYAQHRIKLAGLVIEPGEVVCWINNPHGFTDAQLAGLLEDGEAVDTSAPTPPEQANEPTEPVTPPVDAAPAGGYTGPREFDADREDAALESELAAAEQIVADAAAGALQLATELPDLVDAPPAAPGAPGTIAPEPHADKADAPTAAGQVDPAPTSIEPAAQAQTNATVPPKPKRSTKK